MDMLTAFIVGIPMLIAGIVGFIFLFFLWPTFWPIFTVIAVLYVVCIFKIGRKPSGQRH